MLEMLDILGHRQAIGALDRKDDGMLPGRGQRPHDNRVNFGGVARPDRACAILGDKNIAWRESQAGLFPGVLEISPGRRDICRGTAADRDDRAAAAGPEQQLQAEQEEDEEGGVQEKRERNHQLCKW